MEMLKMLTEAKENGLSNEDFFQLLDLEIKLNESKRQISDSAARNSSSSENRIAGFEKLLQEICYKLDSQQQEHLKLQHSVRELFQQQNNNLQHQFNHLQQQLQKLEVAQNQELKQIQDQTAECMARCNKQPQKSYNNQEVLGHEIRDDKRFAWLVQEIKDKFHVVENTLLNRLQEEKCFMRDELTKAQNEILALLSNIAEDITQVKEVTRSSALNGIEKQIEQLQKICEEVLVLQKQALKGYSDDMCKDRKNEGCSQTDRFGNQTVNPLKMTDPIVEEKQYHRSYNKYPPQTNKKKGIKESKIYCSYLDPNEFEFDPPF